MILTFFPMAIISNKKFRLYLFYILVIFGFILWPISSSVFLYSYVFKPIIESMIVELLYLPLIIIYLYYIFNYGRKHFQ